MENSDVAYLKYTFNAQAHTVSFIDCDMGDSTYKKLEIINFVNCKNAPTSNGSNFLGSLFGKGSLTMIFSLLALIVSVATAGAFISWKQKKTAFAGVNGSAGGENKHA